MGDTTRAIPSVESPDSLEARLEVVDGPDRGASVDLDERVLVGTSERCTLRLSDPTVSRRHLEVSRCALGAHVKDAGSRNGTWHGTTRILEAELAPGETLRIGGTTLQVVEVKVARRAPRADDGAVRERFGRFLGRAKSLQSLYRQLVKIAPTRATALLEGESGTGKELLAEAIHEHGHDPDGPFVVVDCGSVPENLIESELFGHERGAFTGAVGTHVGAFEQAHGGTIFLDEIGELPLAMQTRLLRVLDRKTIRRLGSQKWIDVDVRVVAATNRNLEREVEESRFRLDLLHRLSVIELRVPPLRERAGDLELLARHFAEQLGADPDAIEAEVVRRGASHDFPGNVRELRNLVERLVLLGDDVPHARASATTGVGGAGGEGGEGGAGELEAIARAELPYRVARARALDAFNRAYTDHMLARHGGNVSSAAKAAGVARRHFYRLKDEPDAS